MTDHRIGTVLGAGEDDDRTHGLVTQQRGKKTALLLVCTGCTTCVISAAVVPCGATSTRTGSRSKLPASDAISFGMVAENSAVRRSECVAFAMRFTSLMKPMSSIRSASSRTSQRVCERSTRPSRIRSVKRPGVAIRTSMPGAMCAHLGQAETPPTQALSRYARVWKHTADRLFNLHGESTRWCQDQRACSFWTALVAKADDLLQDRQAGKLRSCRSPSSVIPAISRPSSWWNTCNWIGSARSCQRLRRP